MTHFAIAGIQTHVAIHNNIPALQHRVDLLMHLYPWVQMVVLSELAAHGPITSSAEPLEGKPRLRFAKWRAGIASGSSQDRSLYVTTTALTTPPW